MPQKRRQPVKEEKADAQSRSRSRRDFKAETQSAKQVPDQLRILNESERSDMKAKISKMKQEKLMKQEEQRKQQEQMEVEKILEEMQLFQPDLPIEQDDISTSISKPIKKPTNQYQAALESLHESQLPSSIPCRDAEKTEIERFLMEGLQNEGHSQALCKQQNFICQDISGVPGIGKTASFLEVKNKLARTQKFTFVHLNGMNLSSPESLYQQMLLELTGIDKVSRNQACLLLTELFTKGKLPTKYGDVGKGNKVILLDECDYLVTPNQQLLYNLVDWPSLPKAQLTVVMIANTMDFPERLKPKLQSRLGNHRLVYKPYTSTQIEEIVTQRLHQSGAKGLFLPEALTFVAKKVATISTDIRKTLEICRSAIQQAEVQYSQLKKKKIIKISIDHIKTAYDKVYSQPYHQCLPYLGQRIKLLLISIALEANFSGYNVAYLSRTTERFNQLMETVVGLPVKFDQGQLEFLLQQLKQINVIDTKSKIWLNAGKSSTSTKPNDGEFVFQQKTQQFNNVTDTTINLLISIDDLKNSMKEDEFFLKFLALF